MNMKDFQPAPFDSARPHLIAPVRTDPSRATGPTRSQAATGRWRRTSRGLYVPSFVDSTVVEQRIVEAAALLPRRYGAVTGWAALRWLGGAWFDGSAPDGTALLVPLASPLTFRGGPGARVCEERLDPAELLVVDGLVVTNAARSVCYEMRYARSPRHAVQTLDLAAYNDLVSIDELVEYVERHPGWTGIDTPRTCAALADENSWSPYETHFRWIWETLAGLPHPLCNRPVFNRSGEHIGTPDLLDASSGLVGEYDSALHLEGRQRRRDRERDERYRDHGLEVVPMLTGDAADPEAVALRIRKALARSRQLPPDQRGWTVEPPGWWTPTFTVAQRRALDLGERERLLRLRRTTG